MSDAPASHQRTRAAAVVRGCKAQLLRVWEQRCRQEMPPVAHLPSRALQDSLLAFLEQLAQDLELASSKQMTKDTAELAKKHGRQRAHLANYSLDQVLCEYQILREVLIGHLTEADALDADVAACTHAVIDRAMRTASTEYVEINRAQETTLRRNVEQAQERLLIEQHKFAAIFAESPALIALMQGPEFRFERANPSFHRSLGDREVVGKTFLEALPELAGQQFMDILRHVYATGEPFVGHEVPAQVVRSKGGKPEPSFWNVAYVRINDGAGRPYGIYNHAHDVTDSVEARKKLEELKTQLENVIVDLQEEQAMRERYVAALTHDLRTPLTAARLAADVINLKPDNSDKVRSKAGIILRNMDRADGMIQDLLDASRAKAGGQLSISLKQCSLSEIVGSATKHFQEIYGSRVASGTVEALQVWWDPTAIQRVLENLISNAVKYGAADTAIEIGCTTHTTDVEVTVHNHGNPIGAMEAATLFDPFKRTASAMDGKQKGWGIGLSVVKGLVEAHGGTVDVESTERAGTTFRIKLPKDARRQQTPNLNAERVAAAQTTEAVALENESLKVVQRETAAELQQAQSDLAKLGETMRSDDRSFSFLSYNLRSPLAAIRLSTQSLAKHLEGTPHLQLVESIGSSASRVDHMLQQFLNRHQHEPSIVDFRECDLTPMLHRLHQKMVHRYGNRFILNCPLYLPGYWDCDALEQALENLCINAVEHGGKGTPIYLDLRGNGDAAIASVTNFGAALSNVDQERLFKPYYRAASTGHHEGWGLGLAYVSQIARFHGGEAAVSSDQERGTTFSLKLPRDARLAFSNETGSGKEPLMP